MNVSQTKPINIQTLNLTTDMWVIANDTFAQVSVLLVSGGWGGAILTAEGSNDKTNWSSLGATVSIPSISTGYFGTAGYQFMRVRVSTAASVPGNVVISMSSIVSSQLSPGTQTISSVVGLQSALNLKRDIADFSVHQSLVSVSCALLASTGSAALAAAWVLPTTVLVSNPQGVQALSDSASSGCDIPTTGTLTVRIQRGLLTPPARTYVVAVHGINIPGI